MTERDASPSQRLFPFLWVDDVGGYLRFLETAFGFSTRLHDKDPKDPEHEHAEASLAGAVVMISHAAKKWGTCAPRALPALSHAVYSHVDDADAHCRRARAAGATIEAEPADMPWGHRMYTAVDPEGHKWFFAAPARR